MSIKIKNIVLILAVIGLCFSSYLFAHAIAPPNKQEASSQAKKSRGADASKSEKAKNSTITIIRQDGESSSDGPDKEGVLIIHD